MFGRTYYTSHCGKFFKVLKMNGAPGACTLTINTFAFMIIELASTESLEAHVSDSKSMLDKVGHILRNLADILDVISNDVDDGLPEDSSLYKTASEPTSSNKAGRTKQ